MKEYGVIHETDWGEISVSFVSASERSRIGSGEIHVKHNGTLAKKATDLDAIASAFGLKQLALNDTHWVVRVQSFSGCEDLKAVGQKLTEAIQNRATGKNIFAKRASAKKVKAKV